MFDENRVVSVQDPQLDGPRRWCHVMYALHALSALSGLAGSATIVGAFAFGWPSIIAVVINYVQRSEVAGSWLESHWRWQLRTFWFAVMWFFVAGAFAITIVGIPVAWLVFIVAGLWVLYRVVRGWTALAGRRDLPLPERK